MARHIHILPSMIRTTVMLEEKQVAGLQRVAKKTGTKVAALIRLAIENHLKSQQLSKAK
jgi:hypothetical protein